MFCLLLEGKSRPPSLNFCCIPESFTQCAQAEVLSSLSRSLKKDNNVVVVF